ncbi:MAG: helicase [Claussenomyces sp. TS43310]|nr:MAG: helicase [Claussenomyces sp. TS43310]
MKKNKTWDDDGILSVRGGHAYLQDSSGREMGKCTFKEPLFPGSTLNVSGKDVEVNEVISKEDYLAGRPFLKVQAKRVPTSTDMTLKTRDRNTPNRPCEKDDKPIPGAAVTPKVFYAPVARAAVGQARYKPPLLTTTLPRSRPGIPTPRHDPNASGALVMKRPTNCPKGRQIVDVVLDPFLGQWIRDHQREGVKFLYECVTGMRPSGGQGALLADAMGLGKTYMTICLIYTLMKQNSIHGADPVIKKALIVCPVTLIRNWKKEFKRWLGNERLGVFVADGMRKDQRLTDFTHGRSYSVMIIGYEKLRNVQDELRAGSGIDLVVCDEGHRLKTDGNKSAQAIKSLDISRRIILSGTPLQNDLGELFVMVDFVNPGILGPYKTFKKEFEMPIMTSRNPESSSKDKRKGEARQAELSRLTRQFVLRREADVLSKYLLPKAEYVIFCRPTTSQRELYQHVIESPVFGKVLGSPEASLQLITVLKKVCNSPSLLLRAKEGAQPNNGNVAKLVQGIPKSLLRSHNVIASSKLRVLDSMLKCVSEETTEKIVIVSNYTSTLDLLGQHLTSLSLPYLRLDGSTPSHKRQDLVDDFNKSSSTKHFAFLLSAKSGGAGINLIGASRLVLFDVDWNPATDLQAMARIHRDGQKRPVKIYRLLMAGGMDEKIYQRQVTKMGLADSVMDGKRNEASFSTAELRDLFTLQIEAGCQTHDLLGCDCKGRGIDPKSSTSLVADDVVSNGSDDEGSDEEDFPAKPALMPANLVDMVVQEQDLRERAEKKRRCHSTRKMQALMDYTHIDTSVFSGETRDVFGLEAREVEEAREALADDVLSRVLERKQCEISFVFAKKG